MEDCYEREQIVHNLTLNRESDALIRQYESKGVYSSKSLYSIINIRGVHPVSVPPVWSICGPPRIQVFLLLLSHNKLMIETI